MDGGLPAGHAGPPDTVCWKASSTQHSVKPSPPFSECQGDMASSLPPPLGKTSQKLLDFGEQLELLEVSLGWGSTGCLGSGPTL